LLAGDGAVLRAAGEEFAAVGRPLLAGQAFEDAAVAYAEGSDTAAARAALSAALACYAGLGASHDTRRAKSRLRPYGLRPVQRAPRGAVSGWAALTPAEVQVADLLRAGKSNPDIAAELFLSRRTVESHVSRILTKLGARSRLEVVAAGRPAEPDNRPV
jgi:DNA-binding NarL/FixJ family response regulator